MYTLFVANKNYSSWSLRPWLVLRELGIPFEERVVPFEEVRAPSFRQNSPSGKVPALHDRSGGGAPIVVWDSLAIVDHLAEAHPAVWPAERVARAWARSATAEMHAGFATLRSVCSMSCGIRVRLPEPSDALRADLDRISALWNDGLDRFGGPYLAGARFTAVDAFFAPVAFRIQTYGLALDPASDAYAARLLALPSMQAWYEAGLAETWRDLAHDAEIVGTIVADLRAR
ncbi:MAG: glutathione S-transferase family protein [Myxococcota bacterium]